MSDCASDQSACEKFISYCPGYSRKTTYSNKMVASTENTNITAHPFVIYVVIHTVVMPTNSLITISDSMVSKLSKRRFTWVDGTPLTGQYLNWGTGEPNNASEDCGSMFLHYEARSMKWNDLSCVHNTKIGYVCEKERHKRIYGGH